MTMMTEEESRAWRPELEGWSDDILPFYKSIVPELRPGALVVELGVARGRSLIFLAEELAATSNDADVYGVDHMSEDYRAALEKNLASASEHAQDIVGIIEDKTVEAARLFGDGTLDMLFIDADHSFDGVKADLEAWFVKVKQGGVIAGHDYSDVDFPGVVRAVDEFATAHGLTVERPTRSVWRLR